MHFKWTYLSNRMDRTLLTKMRQLTKGQIKEYNETYDSKTKVAENSWSSYYISRGSIKALSSIWSVMYCSFSIMLDASRFPKVEMSRLYSKFCGLFCFRCRKISNSFRFFCISWYSSFSWSYRLFIFIWDLDCWFLKRRSYCWIASALHFLK